MSINRVSSGFLTDQAIFHVNTNQLLMSRLQERLASGQNINQPSDDPVGLTRILSLSNTLKTDERFARNIEQATAEVNTSDTVMNNVTDLIHRAKELGVQGATFTNNQNGRDGIALEIDEIINQMVQLGNTAISGKFLFAGMRTSTTPFNRIGDDVTYAGTPATEDFGRPAEISRGVEVDININGENLLGQASLATSIPPVFNPGSGGVFRTLIELKLNLEQGDTDEVRLRLDELDTDLNNVLAQQARVGSVSNRLNLTANRLQEREAIFTQQYASIQDIDMAATIADLNQQESTFQASLAVTARAIQPSLLNFLR
ncbi:MAG: flagellar hook-associated protein FlgL [Vampirovibrio sp.]|nr:flagellar hook-associated protein FlgL [Vampirovibrio sp.]